MNLYKIIRNDESNWDEYEGFVVRSSSGELGLGICQELAKSGWRNDITYFTDVTIETLATDVNGEEEIILCDYKAG